MQPPVAGSNEIVVSGQGSHSLSSKYLDKKLSLRFAGEVCDVQGLPRDIVFVVDVSGSMGGVNGNDPIVNGTCGRRIAIESVVASAGENSGVRYGIVTFSSNVVAKSSAMQPSIAALTNDILSAAGKTQINDVLCAAISGTNYDAGLKGVNQVFSSGRANAVKELYFVSDGAPDPGNEGKPAAAALRTTGVTVGGKTTPVMIATTMLGTEDDSILKNDIASKDANGAPIHARVDRASDLADTLKTLSNNRLVDGNVTYGVKGQTQKATVSLIQFLKSPTYMSDKASLDSTTFQGGIDIQIQFKDKASNVDQKTGTITFDTTLD